METLKNILTAEFGPGEVPRTFTAPARINVIGEHVDYLGGYVLPAAIDFSVNLAIRKNDRGEYGCYSFQYKQKIVTKEIQKSSNDLWINYIFGVVDELQKEGHKITGFDLVMDGNIPQGAGLSSSAAVEVVVGYALSELFQLNLSREKIALIGQAAENHFVGTRCGIMDQYIIANGQKDKCILLNTETLEKSFHSLELKDHEFYLINSSVKHSLHDSDYNNRRKECENALQKVQKLKPEIKNLYSLDENSDLKIFQFSENEGKRILHVLGEKKRTRDLLSAFEEGNLKKAGDCLFSAHDSLSKLYEVSCEETDFIVNFLREKDVTGARMIGGGFGGCILVLDKKGQREKISEELKNKYLQKFGLSVDFYIFNISDGVREVGLN